jgi:hypothetical protein
MTNRRQALWAALLILAVVAVPFVSQAAERTEAIEFLTGANAGQPRDIALNYLKARQLAAGYSVSDVDSLTVRDSHVSSHNGVSHFYLRQQVEGLEVINRVISINVAQDGSVINTGGRMVPNLLKAVTARTPELSPAAAIRSAAAQLNLELTGDLQPVKTVRGDQLRFTGAGISENDIPVKLAYFATEDDQLRLAWDLVIYHPKHWLNVQIDALTGALLEAHNWTHADSYEVFAMPKDSPYDGARTVESNPANATASPFGWHDTNGAAGAEFTDTRGNNVSAQDDPRGNNRGNNRPDGGAGLNFSFALDLNQDPDTYLEAATTNLFYWNNIIHDVLYQYGFDEASGNFQENNYGKGGAGGDSVNADAQDGSGTNNANFSTPADGSNPRMQMFVWTPPFAAIVRVNSPGSIAGDFLAGDAEFGRGLKNNGVTGNVVLADDGTGTTTDGCEPFVNAGAMNGNIALIDRGTCSFVVKVKNAQDAGADAAIVVNNQGDGVIPMGGSDGSIRISSVFIGQSDGDAIKGELAGGVNVTLLPGNSNTLPPNRDSDLDNGIIAHEYGHGVSTRLTGGAGTSNCLGGSQQAGEGWSDFMALWFTAKTGDTATTARGVGTYANFDPAGGLGIRQYPYTTDMGVNPHVYSDIAGVSVPHGVGSVWTAAVWEVYWNLVGAHGFSSDRYNGTAGNNIAMQLVIDGLKLQPCNPTFLDARDAILLADQINNGGANQCLIWAGFAKRGMGVNANDGGSSSSVTVTDDFTVPGSCP